MTERPSDAWWSPVPGAPPVPSEPGPPAAPEPDHAAYAAIWRANDPYGPRAAPPTPHRRVGPWLVLVVLAVLAVVVMLVAALGAPGR